VTVLVSVIIPARNAERTAQDVLDALSRQTLTREKYEVIVVDDRSTDRTREVVRAREFARLVAMPRHGGSYAARNLGLDHARGEVMAFTDADCRPAPDWLESGLADLDAYSADLLSGHVDVPLRAHPSVTEVVDVCWHLDQVRFFRMGFAATANLFVRRAVFEQVGGFNGRLTSNGDCEFCLRATAHDLELAYSARAVVAHPPRTRPSQAVRKAFRLGYGRAQTEVDGSMPRCMTAISRHAPKRRGLLLAGEMRALIVGREIFGIDRVRSQGYEPSRAKLILIRLAAYLQVDLPRIAGYVVGRVRAHRALRGGIGPPRGHPTIP